MASGMGRAAGARTGTVPEDARPVDRKALCRPRCGGLRTSVQRHRGGQALAQHALEMGGGGGDEHGGLARQGENPQAGKTKKGKGGVGERGGDRGGGRYIKKK